MVTFFFNVLTEPSCKIEDAGPHWCGYMHQQLHRVTIQFDYTDSIQEDGHSPADGDMKRALAEALCGTSTWGGRSRVALALESALKARGGPGRACTPKTTFEKLETGEAFLFMRMESPHAAPTVCRKIMPTDTRQGIMVATTDKGRPIYQGTPGGDNFWKLLPDDEVYEVNTVIAMPDFYENWKKAHTARAEEEQRLNQERWRDSMVRQLKAAQEKKS